MKKLATILLAMTLAVSTLSGCTNNKTPPNSSSSSLASVAPPVSSAASSSAQPSGAALKTGLGVRSTVTKSNPASAEAEGVAQAESTIVGVLVDASGKIVSCVIDETQVKIHFDKNGKLETLADAKFQTKSEQGDAYGMKKASAIGKEWKEQAAAFAQYVLGKTVDEIKGITVNDKGAPTDQELSSSVTISVGSFIGALEAAVKNAQELGAREGDTLGLGVVSSAEKSQDAGEAAGLAQADSAYTVNTFDADGRVTSCVLDGTQTKVEFDKSGKITTDLTMMQKSKNELGERYGMKKASSIGKEWNEQAQAFATYATGKTVAELRTIAVNEKGAPSDSELAATVTVAVGDFIAVIEKASHSAK